VRDGCLSSTVALTRVTSARRGQLESYLLAWPCPGGRVRERKRRSRAPLDPLYRTVPTPPCPRYPSYHPHLHPSPSCPT